VEQLMPHRIDSINLGTDPLANKVEGFIPHEAGEYPIVCGESCIHPPVKDLDGGIVSQLFERFSRYIRKLTD
jgi:hypothetical protein